MGGQHAPDGDTEASNLSAGPVPDPLHDNPSDKPLPKLQIFLLCYARMMEPIAFFSIFPFIAQMVARNGHLPDSDVGFYSGLIESLFSAVQMLVLIFWGRLADKKGRKPVLLCSLVGMVVSPVLFGLSQTLWQMILFRCIAGAFSGSSLVIRTMIAEHSTPATQARAFSWFAFGGNVGIFIGPIVGGVLADPVTQYPRVFKGIGFFEDYPYALPGFVVGGICATSVVTSFFLLEETLPKDASGKNSGNRKESELSIWELLKAPGVRIVLWVYSHAMFLAFTFTAIMPVALYTPVKLGGLGFGPSLIAAYMAAQGASQALWLLLAFPWLQKRIGTKGVMVVCGVTYPFMFALYILLNVFLRDGSQTGVAFFWVVGGLAVAIGPGVSMAFTGAQLALNDVSPNSQVLGTLNAVALTATSAIRAVAPGVSTAVYAVGLRNHILLGHLAWVILIPCAAAFGVCTKWLPEGRKPQTTEADEEDS